MNEFFKKFENIKNLPILKVLFLAVVGVIILALVVWLVSFSLRSAFVGVNSVRSGSSQSYPAMYEKDVSAVDYGGSAGLSPRNVIMPPVPGWGYTTGEDAEEYEVKDYSGTFETANLEKVCGALENLKQFDYVVFETSNRGDVFCNYVFKVRNENAEEVKRAVEDLNPRTFVANTETIKMTLDDFTSQEEILTKKLQSIEQTLTEAQRSYDELRILATQSRDAESLAKVIESKINLIERLTNERLNLRSQLDYLARDRQVQLDRLEYTYFRLYVVERLIVDFKMIKDSWRRELKSFVSEFNEVIQGVSVNLLSFALRFIQAALYFILALLIVKYGWRFTKKLWRL